MPANVAKASNQKIIAPATAPVAPAAARPAAPAAPAAAPPAPLPQAASPQQQPAADKAAAAAAAAKKDKAVQTAKLGFKVNEWIVYPAHGVGRIVAIEEQEIAGISLELFVITFEKDKMTLRVPTGKSASVGMRKLAEEATVKKAIETLKGRARVKRTMWSRRAQEYEAKINSGDLIAIAEVVRDLYRSESQPEQSYSERQLYEAALDRMAREIAVVEKLDERGAVQRITEVLAKSARGRGVAEAA
jgi:CarD family transcriptional regulator